MERKISYQEARAEELRIMAEHEAALRRLAAEVISEVNAVSGAAYKLAKEYVCGHLFLEARDGSSELNITYKDYCQPEVKFDGTRHNCGNPTHLSVSAALPRGPLNCSGSDYLVYEERQRYEMAPHSVNVAVSKGAAKIAAEINRRLLPEYSRLVPLVLEGIKREAEARDRTTANLERLARATGQTLNDRERQERYLYAPGATVRVHDNSVTFERIHSVTVEQAERILKVLQEGK